MLPSTNGKYLWYNLVNLVGFFLGYPTLNLVEVINIFGVAECLKVTTQVFHSPYSVGELMRLFFSLIYMRKVFLLQSC